MILAEKIAQLRRQKGWSQEELANHLQVSRQAVSKWEGGASIPDLDKILKLSALFEVSTDYLLKDELEAPEVRAQSVVAGRACLGDKRTRIKGSTAREGEDAKNTRRLHRVGAAAWCCTYGFKTVSARSGISGGRPASRRAGEAA